LDAVLPRRNKPAAADKAIERGNPRTAVGAAAYVVLARISIALTVGKDFGKGELNVAHKLGVTDKEIDKLCGAVLNALTEGLDPNQIREATAMPRAVGRRRQEEGMTTTLPLALGFFKRPATFEEFRCGRRSAALLIHRVAA
jgi:hypothetical protein